VNLLTAIEVESTFLFVPVPKTENVAAEILALAPKEEVSKGNSAR
jgi:hypothetical protein